MSKRFAFGAVIGMVAGVIAGVLTAPKSGKETRGSIKHKAHELKSKATDSKNMVKDKAMKTTEGFMNHGDSASEEMKK